jgi:hypothetical protein
MKRGFLLRAEERKAAARSRHAQKHSQSVFVDPAVAPHASQHPKGEDHKRYTLGMQKQADNVILQDLMPVKELSSGKPTPENNGEYMR